SLLRRSPLSAFLFYFLGPHRALPSFPTRRSSDLTHVALRRPDLLRGLVLVEPGLPPAALLPGSPDGERFAAVRSERTRRLTEMVNAGKIDEAVEHFVDAISGPGTYRARSDAANQMTRDNIRTALRETRDTREPVTREPAAT